MNSDDEDFNDIYGDESTSTTTVVENKDEAKKDGDAKNSSAKVSTSNTTSSLDQLAALQALSSNLNQVSTPNSSNNNNNYENSSDNKSNSNNNNDNSENRGESTSTSNDKASAPAEMSWEQLQQTMSQFQPQSSGAALQNSSMGPVKADLSRDICKMFIGGLNWETTEDTLRDYFSKYGKVIDLKIMKDTNTGRSRGFGFLTFDEPTSVDEVVKTQHILDGKVIDPKRAIPREEQDKTGKIFVGGIGADVRPKEFEEFFAQWGTIIDAQLMLDKDTGRSRGFGFVTYDSPDAVDRVCQNKFIDFKGKKIEIKRAEPRHMQKQQGHEGSAQSPPGGGNPMAQMYQNPMMGGFNPMFNPQAMAEYYQKMQEYYQQMQQQTGMDYSQMFQQQMQQMSMMMPGYNMPGAGNPGSASSESGTPNQGEEGNSNSNSASNVQTIGGETSESKVGGSDESSDSGENKLQINLPRGPRGPSSSADQGSHSSYGQRDGNRDSNRDRDYHYRGGNRNGYRGGNGGGYRGRGGYNRRNNGYHPYNR